jgi:BMFP domain-containing protein YqiC
MIDPKVFDDLAQRLSAAVPSGVRELQGDIEKNLRSALQAGLGRLNLVTREEFDVQAAVLARSRQKLDELAARVESLEAALGIQRKTR